MQFLQTTDCRFFTSTCTLHPGWCPLAALQPSLVAPSSDEHLGASNPTDVPPRASQPIPVPAPSFSHAHPLPHFPLHYSPSGQASAVSLQPLGGATLRSLRPEAAAAPASVWSRSTWGNVGASAAVQFIMLCRDVERRMTVRCLFQQPRRRTKCKTRRLLSRNRCVCLSSQ